MASLLDILTGHPSTGFQTQPSYSSLNSGLTAAFLQASQQANQANKQRLAQAMAIYDEIINRYKGGGAFEKSALQQLGTRKKIETGKEKQSLISSGLANTTIMGGVGRRWEAEVGAPARLKLEDIMMQRLSQAQLDKAGLIERVEDVGPDLSALSGLGSGGHTYSQTINWPQKSSEPNLIDIPLPKSTGSTGPITRESAGLTPKYMPYGTSTGGSAGADTSLEAYRQYASGLVTGKQLEPGQGPIGYEAWKKLMTKA